MTTDSPDTDELLLRDVEAAVARARTAADAQRWDALAMNMALVSMQSQRLIEYLQPRLAVVTGVGPFG